MPSLHCQYPVDRTHSPPLQGDFLMLWDKYGIGEGDVLTFRKDPLTAIVSFICSPVSGPPKGHPARTGLRAQTTVRGLTAMDMDTLPSIPLARSKVILYHAASIAC